MSQSDLDTIPTVASSYTLPSETADSSSAVPVADVNDDRPLAVRIEDKNWKCRLSAYEDLKNLIVKNNGGDELSGDGNSTASSAVIFTEYNNKIHKFCADSNATALDAALDLAIVFIENVPTYSVIKDYVDNICSVVLDKSFSSRPSTQLKGKMIFIKIMEVEDPHVPTKVLLSKLNEKRPKIPPLCLELIAEGIASFGIKSFPVKEILKELPAVLNGSNGPARELAMTLLLDMSKWIGKAPLNSIIESLRDVQKLQFEKAFSETDMTSIMLRPTVYLRKDKHLAVTVTSSNNTTGTDSNSTGVTTNALPQVEGMKLDAREFIDEIDIEKKIKASEYNTLINEEKWSEQLKATQLIIDMLGQTPKVKPGTATIDVLKPVINKIKSLLSSNTTHINLQVNALKIVTLLADGLRNDFNTLIRPHIELIILKCKEKKLLSDVTMCLANLLKYCCASFDSMSEYIIEEIKSKKTPAHGRVLLMDFVSSSLSTVGEKFNGSNLKALVGPLKQCIDDSDPTVRSACVMTLAHAYALAMKKGKVANDALKLISALENVNSKVFKKIKEGPSACASTAAAPSTNVAKSTTSLSSTGTTITSAQSNPATATSTTRPSTASSATPVLSKPTTSVGASKLSKPSSAASSAGSSKPSSTGDKKAASVSSPEETVEELNVNVDDAKTELAGLAIENWESGFQELICSAKWQEKVEALSILTAKVIETKTGGRFSKALVSYLSHHTGKFKISNINILKSVIQFFCAAAQSAKAAATSEDLQNNVATEMKFSKAAAWDLIKNFGDKLSDKKTKDLVCELLTALNECISPAFVVKRMIDGVLREKCVAPLAHQHFLEWLKSSIKDFGAAVFPLKFILDFLVTVELENKNAQVRTCAIEVIGGIYNQIGQRIHVDMKIDDMKPALKSVIDAEIVKVGFDPTAITTTAKKVLGDVDGALIDGAAGLMSAKIDLLSFLDKNINFELTLTEGKTSWQNRKTAMENIIAACDKAGHSIEGSKSVVELVKSLKARMNDTQANLKPIAVNAIGHVLCSLDADVACKYLKGIAASLLGGLADNKKQMRSATVEALQMIVTLNKAPAQAAVGDYALLAALIAPISEFIVTNTIGREELLIWFNSHLSCIKVDCTDLAPPMILALQDKTAVVRAEAEKVLIYLVGKSLVAKKTVERIAGDLPPAQMRALQGSIGKIMEAAVGKKDKNSGGGGGGGGVSVSTTTLSSTAATVITEATVATSSDEVSQSSTHILLQKLRNLNEEMCTGGSQPMDDFSAPSVPKAASLVHSGTKASSRVSSSPIMPPSAPVSSATGSNRTSPEASKILRGGTPTASTPKLFLSPASSPDTDSNKIGDEEALYQLNQAIHEVEEIYLDIILKVDHLLQFNGTALTPTKMSYETIHSDAKTNLKVLNSILNGEWVFRTGDEESIDAADVEEENDIMYKYTQNIIRLLVQCIDRGFPEGSRELYDLSIIKLAMANLYAMIKRSDVLIRFGDRCVYDVFKMCLMKLVDGRVAEVQELDGSNKYLEIGNALNMIVLKLANDSAPDVVLTALIKILLSAATESAGSNVSLSGCMDPIAKIIRQVLGKMSNDSDGSEMPMSCLKSLLETIHSSYVAYPPSSANTPHDDVLLCTLKTVLKVLTKKVGTGKIVSAIDNSTMGISHESFIFQTVLRLSNSAGASKELQIEVDAVIDLIITAKDKNAHIQQLYAIQKANPHINLDNYMSKASSIFKKFIQNELSKLSSEDSGAVASSDSSAEAGRKSGSSNDENRKPTSSVLGSMMNVKDIASYYRQQMNG